MLTMAANYKGEKKSEGRKDACLRKTYRVCIGTRDELVKK